MSRIVRQILRVVLYTVLGFYGVCLSGLCYLKFLPPLFTTVQLQHQIESFFAPGAYTKRYTYVPLSQISDHLEHAVVAAEDSRFFAHRGFDWQELEKAWQTARRRSKPMRGASTISQQLVKNLFLTTHRSFLRKGLEYTLTPLAELILGKQRILELYLNVIEWGPGVYGAEAAARYHYDTSAVTLTREQASRLAAVIPAPRTRIPQRMDGYSAIIQTRMRQMGW
jgi:monofunctional glycosyltransferase